MGLKEKHTGTAASWSDSRNVCALSGDDRHSGHIVRAGEGWFAFDATHLNEHGSWFRLPGFFPAIMSAKDAVQAATLSPASTVDGLSRSASAIGG